MSLSTVHAPNSDALLAAIHDDMFRLLSEFNAFCSANDIHYSLHGGTLLGALRYADFIPWDDDLDISIAREDYKRLQVALKSQSAFVVDLRGTWTPRLSFAPARNGTPTMDIFIWDYISERPVMAKLKLLLLALVQGMLHKSFCYTKKYPFSKNVLLLLAWLAGRLFPFGMKIRLYDWISRHLDGKRLRVHRSNDSFGSMSYIYPAADTIGSYDTLPFRNKEFPVIHNYREELIKSYGADYMTPPPPEKRIPRHVARPEDAP